MSTMEDVQKARNRVYRQVVRPPTFASRREWRSEENLGHNYLHMQGAEAQSARYYFSA